MVTTTSITSTVPNLDTLLHMGIPLSVSLLTAAGCSVAEMAPATSLPAITEIAV